MRKAIFLFTLLVVGAIAARGDYSLTPDIHGSGTYDEYLVADDDSVRYSEVMSIIGASKIQATIIPVNQIDSLYITWEVSNDKSNWVASQESLLVEPDTNIAPVFLYSAVFRYHRIRTSYATALDSLFIQWRAGEDSF